MTKGPRLTDNQIAEIRNWRKHISERCRSTWDKAMTRKSLRAAIQAKCHDCMNWNTAEVRECDIITCPLWMHRKQMDEEQVVLREQIRGVVAGLCEIQREGAAVGLLQE